MSIRIGIMLRAQNEKGGVGLYTRNIVSELLKLDRDNKYVLFCKEKGAAGPFAGFPNVTVRFVRGFNKAWWDQVAIPVACWREGIDVLFHPKFTAPLLAPCPVVMTVHGADWFVPEQAKFYKPLDIYYIRAFMPLYFRKSACVISVSQLTTDNFNRVLRLPSGKVRTVYLAPARHFHRVDDPELLKAVRTRYSLPERFILTLTKRGGGERKNLGRVFEAFADYHGRVEQPAALVVGGKDCHLFRGEYGLSSNGWGRDIQFPGWIDQDDLPAVYSLADLYLYPSNLEAFPVPITEAMACGTPIVTSDANGLREIAGDAALLVDPDDSGAIADAVFQIHSNPELRRELSRRGLARAQRYSWDECAVKTLDILTEAASARRLAPSRTSRGPQIE